MIANRFATEHYGYNDQNGNTQLQISNTSPKPIRSIKKPRHPDSPRDFLANRVSFYMDDVLASSNDDVDNSSFDLRYQQSIKRSQNPRNLLARERSFRVGDRKPVRVYRHSSDVCPSSRPAKLQRKRSSNGSRRQPGRRGSYGGTIERTDSRSILRSASYRSTGSGSGKPRRQDSGSMNGGSKRASTRRGSSPYQTESSFKLPHKKLPPKERRRRIVVLMVVSTFLFLVACSVLVVVVTLTHSSFHRNAYYLPDTAEHLYPRNNYTVRKETEEMVNAINRDEEGEYNDTVIGVAAGSSPLPPGL
ncbi:uncharacterized protein [Periplaneta americana]|uniref:uncharacterized protein isoform X1 n=1 Tax=Periplaneta americana TaxID=6978 RepID=UPI0037E7D250